MRYYTYKINSDNNKTRIEKFKIHHQGWKAIRTPYNSEQEKDYSMYILADENTGSAAELYINTLKNIYDVTLIGTDTSGAFLTGNRRDWYLPKSKMKITSCTSLALPANLQNRDGIGIMPDLWVPSDKALENTLKFIQLKK